MGRQGKHRPQLSKDLDDATIEKLTTPYSLVEVERSKNNERSTVKTDEGTLVWAKDFGSIYWPAVISDLPDKPDVPAPEPSAQGPAILSSNAVATITYLEERFRIAVIPWNRLIPAYEDDVDTQIELIVHLNKKIGKKQFPHGFKTSLDYLKEFCSYKQQERRAKTEEKYKEFELQKEKRRESLPSTSKAKPIEDPKQLENDLKKKHKALVKHRASIKSQAGYSLRSPPPPVLPIEKPVAIPVNSKQGTDAKTITTTTTTSNGAALKAETPLNNVEEVKKDGRPKGGQALKKWAEERFHPIDKTFRYESHNYVICSDVKCAEKINIAEGETPVYCHDFPFHGKCITEIQVSNGDMEPKTVKKCSDCVSKHCFLCKSSEGEEKILKCSKCELKYHIGCLKTFPQAEIQSPVGPITCPYHYCHTCISEHEIMKKVRNYKANRSTSLRCIKCPTSYHRYCLPACSISTIMAKDFIICPRHQDFELGNNVRRLGCFMCNKRLNQKTKGGPPPVEVNCVKCPLSYHLKCVADEKLFEGNPNVLEEYLKTFECEACFWGLYPLPGQAVWYAQGRFPFWPARVLYPKEAVLRRGRADSLGPSHSFSIGYFGTAPKYFDEARCVRTTPLNIAAYDVLQKIKMYTDEPKLKTAYEEGTYVMDLSDQHRAAILPEAEPIYKKIEKNVYKTGNGGSRNPRSSTNKLKGSNKRNIEDEEIESHNCNCHDDKNAKEICTESSGCINASVMIECDDTTCGDATRCSNRMFSNPGKYLERLEAFVTKKKGWGVRNVVPIKKGEFVVEYLGEVISKDLYQWRLGRKVSNDAHYFLQLDKKTGNFIDAEYLGNLSRLINHSCQPNCSTEKYISGGKKVVGIFAKYDIPVGTELTFDYAYEMLGDSKTFNCCCGAVNCSGEINAKHLRNNQVGGSGFSPSKIKRDEDWKEHCEICLFPGESLLCCEAPGCAKVYHHKCIGLNSVPNGVWICPEHTDLNKKSKPVKRKAVTGKGRNSRSSSSSSTTAVKKPKLTVVKTSANSTKKHIKRKSNVDELKKGKDKDENKAPAPIES